MGENLILVNKDDVVCGEMEKYEVHKRGLLHRAFSVFIFNINGQLLLQQRAEGKYHSPNLWSNSCCSHPSTGEELETAVKRRIKQELGLQCQTQFVYNFIYNEILDNGLTENEFDHVFWGVSDELPNLNKEEVKDCKYVDLNELYEDIKLNPAGYTVWLRYCISHFITALNAI